MCRGPAALTNRSPERYGLSILSHSWRSSSKKCRVTGADFEADEVAGQRKLVAG